MESTKIFSNVSTGKEIAVDSSSEILVINKKVWTIDTDNILNESPENLAEKKDNPIWFHLYNILKQEKF